MRKFIFVACCLCSSLSFAAGKDVASKGRVTVAVLPLVSTSSAEYQWIGVGLSSALTMRIYQESSLNTVTQRQINAAVRHDNIDTSKLADPATATKVARLVGADLVMTGSYEASWPELQINFKLIDPQSGKVKNSYGIDGDLDKLADLEMRAAKALLLELGLKNANPEVGGFGTSSVKAWRLTTLAQQTMSWQSLAPLSAAPGKVLSLPKGTIESAKKQLNDAVHLDANYGEAWAAQGIAAALLGDGKEAATHFAKATALGAGFHPTAVLGVSFLKMREGRFDEAASILSGAIAKYPGFLHARGYLGELYNYQGRRREALAAFDDYNKVAPRQPWVLAQRGYAKSKLGDHNGAIADTIAAVDLLPDSPSLVIELASRYIDGKKLIGAEDSLTHALKLFPDEPRIYVRLSYVYLLQGKDAEAIAMSQKALTMPHFNDAEHDMGYAHLNLARAYGHAGDLNKALEHIDGAKKAGLSRFDEIEADPKLASLRADTRYQKLVE